MRLEYALLGLLAGLWGSSYLFAKVALETIAPLTLAATRVTIAAVVLALVARLLRAPWPRDGATWRTLFVQSLFNSTLAWSILAWGQQYVDSGLAGVLNSTSPIFVVLITLVFLKREALGGWQIGGALLGFAGVVATIGFDVLNTLGRDILAQAAVLFSAFLYGVAALHGRHLAHVPPIVTAAATTLLAALFLVPASLVLERPWTLEPSMRSLAAAGALGFLCTAVALLIYFRLLRTLGAMGVTSQSYLRAGVSVLLGIWLLDERMAPATGLGLAAVILGVAAINRRAGTPAARA